MAQEDVLGSGWGDDEEEDLYPVGGRISTLGYAYDDSFTREEIEEILSPLMGKDLTIDQYQNNGYDRKYEKYNLPHSGCFKQSRPEIQKDRFRSMQSC